MSDRDSELVRSLRSTSTALYLELDVEDRVIYENAHVTELFGAEVTGRRFSDLLVHFERGAPGGLARSAAEPRLVNLMPRGGLPVTYRCLFVSADDRVIVLGAAEPRSLTLMQETLVSSQRDLVNEARQLQTANAELARLGKTRDKFFGMAAHDLRTPLATILASVELLDEELAGRINDEERQTLQWIRRATDLMRAVVDGFLIAALSSAGKLTIRRADTDLGSVANDVIAMLRRIADQKGVGLEASIPPDLPRVVVDGHKIEQVLINLLRNGIEHSKAGDRVTLTVRLDEGGSISLEVHDDGAGIPPELRATLFEAYAHATNKTARERSVGLGLALSKLIVDGHGGELSVDSAPERGTTFHVRLPER